MNSGFGWLRATRSALFVAAALALLTPKNASAKEPSNCFVVASHLADVAIESRSPSARVGGDRQSSGNIPNSNTIYDNVTDALGRLLELGITNHASPEQVVEAVFAAVRDNPAQPENAEKLSKIYKAFVNFIPPALGVEIAGLYHARTGKRLDPNAFAFNPPKDIPEDHPGILFLRKHGYHFNHANRVFDALSTLPAVRAHLLQVQADVQKRFNSPEQVRAEMNKYVADWLPKFEGFWANHGEGHTVEVAFIGFRELAAKKGKIRPDLYGGTVSMFAWFSNMHDQGMFDPRNAKWNRIQHFLNNGMNNFGAKLPGQEVQRELAQKGLREMALDKTDPMVAAAYDVANTQIVKDRLKGTELERVQTVLREASLGTWAHGSIKGKFEVDLGLKNSAVRRKEYYKLLTENMPDGTPTQIDLHNFYKNPEEGFSVWARDDNGPMSPADAKALDVFKRMVSLASTELCSADADRSGGKGGGVSGGGRGQPYIMQGAKGPLGGIVMMDPREGVGQKVAVETGPRQVRSQAVREVVLKVTQAGSVHFEAEVPLTVDNTHEYGAQIGGKAGNVVGNKNRTERAFEEDVDGEIPDKTPVLTIRLPFGKHQTAALEKGAKEAAVEEMTTSFIRNRRFLKEAYGADYARLTDRSGTPQEKEARSAEAKAKMSAWLNAPERDIVRFVHVPPPPEQLLPVAKNLPQLHNMFADGKPLASDAKLYDRVKFGLIDGGLPKNPRTFVSRDGKETTYTVDKLLEGAKIVTLPPGFHLIEVDAGTDYGYVHFGGTLKIRPKAATGNYDQVSTIERASGRTSPMGWTSALGGESHMQPDGSRKAVMTTPRNADVWAAADSKEPVQVVMLSPEIMRLYVDQNVITTKPEELMDVLSNYRLSQRRIPTLKSEEP